VDSFDFHEQAWLELERRTRLGFTPEFIHSTFGMTNPSIFRRLLGDKLSDHEVARYSDLKEECYRDVARGRIRLLDGMRELLDALTGRGVKLAIGSSGPLANLELSISDCGLDGRFAAIASLEDLTRGKPDPQVFLIAAARVGAQPARSVVFEDATVGIQAAKAAGMYAVGLTTTHPTATLAESGADEVVESLCGYNVDRLVARLRANGQS
jgi:HAD superfamily hydrolase (TIGR01509 family)